MMLKHQNWKRLSIIAITLGIVIWLILLRINGIQPGLSLEAMNQILTVISIEGGLGWLFIHWVWRWKPLQPWLVTFPDLQGTWQGTLKSSWLDPTTESHMPPIQAQLIIRQNFLSVHCTLMTTESKSKSDCVCLHLDTETNEKYLTCTYINIPKIHIRDRSEIHKGTMSLQVFNGKKKSLKGAYWTDRLTRGDLELSFVSRQLEDTFTGATRRLVSPIERLKQLSRTKAEIPRDRKTGT